jgi:hypothetical protein
MSEFAVGPAVGREWVEHGRQSLVCDRGPCRFFPTAYLRIGSNQNRELHFGLQASRRKPRNPGSGSNQVISETRRHDLWSKALCPNKE